jgi:hypothetical protein
MYRGCYLFIFIRPHSIYELNLPHGKTSQINQLMRDAISNPGVLHPEVFDDIQAVIFTQMQFSSFMRFKASYSKKPKSPHRTRVFPESTLMKAVSFTSANQTSPVTVVIERPRISSGIQPQNKIF